MRKFKLIKNAKDYGDGRVKVGGVYDETYCPWTSNGNQDSFVLDAVEHYPEDWEEVFEEENAQIKQYKFVGTDSDAKEYDLKDYPIVGKTYTADRVFSEETVEYWAKNPMVANEWEEVKHSPSFVVNAGSSFSVNSGASFRVGPAVTFGCGTSIINEAPTNPDHYKKGKIECWDAIESATVGKQGIEAYYVGNIFKYLWRYENKGGVTDIEKAQVYLNKLLSLKQKEQ